MVAQFNLSELPVNSFPIATGILQFWVANDDGFGIDCDNYIGQKHTRAVYYPTIETCFSEEELLAHYTPLPVDEYFPVTSSYKLSFKKDREIISTTDFSFDNEFAVAWNSLYSDDEIEEYWDVDVEDIDELFSEIKGFGHKLLGYPYMYHDDRDGKVKHHDYILLFQMDSDDALDNPIMWGDCGLCYFFIKEEDLKNCDFSKVLYSWGCS